MILVFKFMVAFMGIVMFSAFFALILAFTINIVTLGKIDAVQYLADFTDKCNL